MKIQEPEPDETKILGNRIPKKKTHREFFKSFYVAGFTYYKGALVFRRLKIGRKLRLLYEPGNAYDPSAIAIYLKKHKIGYVPRAQNAEMAALLRVGFRNFETIVLQRSPEEHPAKQLRVGVFLLRMKKKKTKKTKRSLRNSIVEKKSPPKETLQMSQAEKNT